jgi:hypothetical protein
MIICLKKWCTVISLRDDASYETTNRPADSVDGQQGRVKTARLSLHCSKHISVDGEQGRVKKTYEERDN